MSTKMIIEERKLGNLTLVDPETRFPWEFFSGGEINCAYQTKNTEGMNDIRIWLHSNAEDEVFIEKAKYHPYECVIGFLDPSDAIKFATKFGDLVTAW